MKKLGRGWQYTVYELENGRVLKRYNNRIISYWQMLKGCFPYTESAPWSFASYYDNCKQAAYDSLKIITNTTLPPHIFGNPFIHSDGLSYEQDYVVPLRKYFKQKTFAEGKSAIDAFVAFNVFLIDHLMIDKSFNMGANFGITKDGKIILTDIGELYTDTTRIKKQITSRIWAKWYVLNKLPSALNDYFITQMDTHVLPMAETLK